MAENTLTYIDPEVVCYLCKKTRIKMEPFPGEDISEGEIWDAVGRFVETRGWRVWRDVEGARIMVCPGCIEAKPREEPEIERFNAHPICRKCRHRKISTKFVGHDVYHESHPDYLQRTCVRCEFAWREAPADGRHNEYEESDNDAEQPESSIEGNGSDNGVWTGDTQAPGKHDSGSAPGGSATQGS